MIEYLLQNDTYMMHLLETSAQYNRCEIGGNVLTRKYARIPTDFGKQMKLEEYELHTVLSHQHMHTAIRAMFNFHFFSICLSI